ncbi:MAG: phosphoadenosine phosphosulfate reductase family protein [Phormidesmis sp. RL_2_1]|nr:phosphoadenosine phosphosulfate reductase family protein [Phormidesmis sp. RL_2_1]
MLRHLIALHRTQGWEGKLFAITADLGRVEWPGTLEHMQAACNQLNVELVIVRRQKGGMIDRWEERRQTLIKRQDADAIASQFSSELGVQKEGDKPFWSSSTARYCTKELKTAEVDRYLRRFKSVVCAVGIRAEKSSSRAKKPHYQVRNDIATVALKASRGFRAKEHEKWAENAIALWKERNCKGRLALTWNAVLDWSVEQVWEALGTTQEELEHRRSLYQAGSVVEALSGWPAHWAYVSGNRRLSCSLCVLASSADIQNGARHNVATWLELALMETQSGWSFQQGKWLNAVSIDSSEQLQTTQEVIAVLYSLKLVKHWNSTFVIALLRTAPTGIVALWQSEVHMQIAEAIKR